MTDLSRYYSAQGTAVETAWKRASYTSIQVLMELTGKPFDEIVLAYITALKPTMLRVVTFAGETTCDARTGRVTVLLDKDKLISYISQEVRVELPDHVSTGHHLGLALKLGIDHPTTKFHYSSPDNPITSISYGFSTVVKTLRDGTSVVLERKAEPPEDPNEEPRSV